MLEHIEKDCLLKDKFWFAVLDSRRSRSCIQKRAKL